MSGKHVAEGLIRRHIRQCADGGSYLWYFDEPTQIGFEWTGFYGHPIEVSHGGFGEPIVGLIYGAPSGRQTLRQWSDSQPFSDSRAPVVQAFQDLCRTWIVSITLPDKWAREPLMVRDVTHG